MSIMSFVLSFVTLT